MNRTSMVGILAACAFLVSDCTSDNRELTGGIEGSGSPVAGPPPPPPSVGIVGNGAISGLGSIVVQGVRYDVERATVTIDGLPGNADDLAVGQIATVTATTDSVELTPSAPALTVSYDTDIAGTIDEVSNDGSRIAVLGQLVVDVNRKDGWQVGTSVAIAGFRNAEGVWSARRVSPEGPVPFVVTGIVHSLDRYAETFGIGGLTVSYEAAEISGSLADGAKVRVTGLSLNAARALVARVVRVLDAALPGDIRDVVLIEGWVTRFASLRDFDVNDYPVATSDSTSFVPLGALEQGSSTELFVRVRGARQADGGVAADRVTVCSDPAQGIVISGHTATLLPNGQVLIVGGDRCNSFAQLFDPADETFALAGRLAMSRGGATATALADGRVLIAGGYFTGATVSPGGSYPLLATAEIYEPATGRFELTGSMQLGRVQHTATLLSDGRVLVVGGVVTNGAGAASNTAELFDARTGTFTGTGSMSTARADQTATLLPSGKVLVVGGWNGHRPDAADDPPYDPTTAELFDSASGLFRTSGTMSTTRIGHSATLVSDDAVLVLGGFGDLALQNIDYVALNPAYAELYPPEPYVFRRLPTPSLAKWGFTATRLESGKVLILGGTVDGTNRYGQPVDTAYLLDPADGSVETVAPLQFARSDHTATLLGDGRVLVLGGRGADGNVVSTVEFWSDSN